MLIWEYVKWFFHDFCLAWLGKRIGGGWVHHIPSDA